MSHELSEISADGFQPLEQREDVVRKVRPSLSYWKDAWLRFRKNKQALLSGVMIVLLALFTWVGPRLWRVDPAAQELYRVLESPNLGREVLVVADSDPDWEKPLAAQAQVPVVDTPVDPVTLPAPQSIEVVGEATSQGVRLKWSPVPGATGYILYRALNAPLDRDHLGIPMETIDEPERTWTEDTFDLSKKRYFYSVVATRGEESTHYGSLEVRVAPAIRWSDALQVAEKRGTAASLKLGQKLRLDARPLGTDTLGRDLLARLMLGARVSLFIGFFAPFLYVLLGVLIGGISGFLGGKVDLWLMRVTDFVLALPFLLFMILFKFVLGAGPGEDGITAMLLAMVLLSWTGAARLVRGQVMQLREAEFVQAARLLGARPSYLIARHLLPNTLGVVLVYLTFAVPSAIFTEAFLSFIGMGVVPPTPSWGSLCNDGIKSFLTYPHEFVFPALLISITVLAFNLLGDGLRDALDPKLR